MFELYVNNEFLVYYSYMQLWQWVKKIYGLQEHSAKATNVTPKTTTVTQQKWRRQQRPLHVRNSTIVLILCTYIMISHAAGLDFSVLILEGM